MSVILSKPPVILSKPSVTLSKPPVILSKAKNPTLGNKTLRYAQGDKRGSPPNAHPAAAHLAQPR